AAPVSAQSRERPSLHHPSAVDVDRLAGDEAGVWPDEERDDRRQLIGGATPLERLMLQHELLVRLGVLVDLLGVGRERSRRHRVHTDPVYAQLTRERARE